MTSPTHIIFDLDGTLLDSSLGILHCFEVTLHEWGREADDDVLRELIGPPLRHSFARLGFGEESLDAVVDTYRGHYATLGVHEATLYDGVGDVLSAMVDDGLHLGVATAKRVDFAQQMLEAQGIAHYFEFVSGASVDLRMTEKIDIMTAVLLQWGQPTPATVWMVGDRHFDMRAAKQLSVWAIGVLWGFGSPDELLEAGADILVAAPDELLALERDRGSHYDGPA